MRQQRGLAAVRRARRRSCSRSTIAVVLVRARARHGSAKPSTDDDAQGGSRRRRRSRTTANNDGVSGQCRAGDTFGVISTKTGVPIARIRAVEPEGELDLALHRREDPDQVRRLLAPAAARPLSRRPLRAQAAPPPVHAQRLRRRRCTYRRDPRVVTRARSTADRVDHEADDGLVALEHHKLDGRRHRRSSRGRSRRIVDRPRARRAADGERPDQGRPDPVGQRRGRRTRALGRRPTFRRSHAHEHPGGGARPARHPLRPPGRPRRARRILERSRRHEARESADADTVRSADRRRGNRHDRRRTDAPHVGRPACACSADIRRQDGSYERGGLVPGRGGARQRRDRLRDAARVAARGERNADLESLLIWGLGQFRVVPRFRPANLCR